MSDSIPNLDTKLKLLHSLLTRQGALKLLGTEDKNMLELLSEEFNGMPIMVYVEELGHMSDDSYQEALVNIRDFLLGQ